MASAYRILLAVLLLVSCSDGSGSVTLDVGPDQSVADLAVDGTVPDTRAGDSVLDRVEGPDEFHFDAVDAVDSSFVPCNPGDGCFLDPCEENAECQSGWCVEHMGEGVCTQLCQEECPPGWSCKPVGSGGPDLTYVCVSGYSNLCKPCAVTADCKSVGGVDDLCVAYGDEGSFCGGSCTADEDCPWGFLCSDVVTVDGISTWQCVAEAGVCPCTEKSTALSLWTPCVASNEFGTCTGKRICADGGLSECDAEVPAEEACNGLDDDCDGQVDEATCDDGNACTVDSCLGEEGCSHEPLSAGECMDGNPCTIADHCVQGECVGTPVDCDDENPCTDDSCDETGGCVFVPNNAKCDDGNPCTVADQCEESVCVGYPVDCDCLEDADCTALEDGDLCNGTLVCDLAATPRKCVVDPETVVLCPSPEGPNAVCLQATCAPETGLCGEAADNEGGACSDDDLCTLGDSCVEGVCTPGVPLLCNDANPCTDDSCDPQAGCQHVPNSQACDDGNACTEADQCASGQCIGSDIVDCDDDNPCTKDLCIPALAGCQHTAVAGPCDDLDPCTINDTCINGACAAGPLVVCNDGNPCTDDACNAQGLCEFVPNAADCDDGNACTLNDHCQEGACVIGGLADCDDDDVCTTDSCDPVQGCLHLLNQVPCNDEDICTTGDHCHLGECISSGTLTCNDANPCTDDACNPASGCLFMPNSNPCDDGNACTASDLCSGGQCVGTEPLGCDDDNPCTTDACDPNSGCLAFANSLACDDGDVCTLNDQCSNSECVPGPALDCDDGNLCTDDSCDPVLGCQHLNNNVLCDDGNACTSGDQCAGGTCVGPDPVACDDGDLCTTDSCLPQSGCHYEAITPCCGNGAVEAGEECDDGNLVPGDGCDGNCQAENDSGCADGSADQVFQQGVMVACNGSFLGTQLALACGPGWHPANPNEYFSYGGKTTNPDQIRWVDTAWNNQGLDVPLSQWQGYYDCSNSSGWDGVCSSSNCTWVSSSEQCYLTFANHNYGYSYGCHCRGGNPNSSTHGVICVNDANTLPRL